MHGGWRRVDESGGALRDVPVVPFDYRRQLEEVNVVCQPGAFVTREAYWAVGGVDERYRYAMDYELWLKLGKRFRVCHVDRLQAAYRYHERSKSMAEYDAFGPETIRASRAHGGRYLSPLYVRYYLPQWHPNIFRLVQVYMSVRRLARTIGGD